MRQISDDPAECMEWAKQVVGGNAPYDEAALVTLVRDKASNKWPRIAAIYALGLLGSDAVSPPIRAILADPAEDETVRSHAAEALGNLGDRDAVRLLRDVLGSDPGPPLRESCEYALSELEPA